MPFFVLAAAAVAAPTIIAAAPAAEAPAAEGRASPARPLSNPGYWMGKSDYPAESLRKGEEGIVGFTVDVDAEGRVGGCRIDQSSGSAALDVQACTLVRQRALFYPALDVAGRPVAGTYSNRVHWVLPKFLPVPEAMDLVTTMIVEADGSISDCRVEKATGAVAARQNVAGTPCLWGHTTAPFRDGAGNPVRRQVRMRMSVDVVPAP